MTSEQYQRKGFPKEDTTATMEDFSKKKKQLNLIEGETALRMIQGQDFLERPPWQNKLILITKF